MSERFPLASEFASVEVSLDLSANGPRLRVGDLNTGRERFLDPLQLQSLTWAPDDFFGALLQTPFGRDDDEPH